MDIKHVFDPLYPPLATNGQKNDSLIILAVMKS